MKLIYLKVEKILSLLSWNSKNKDKIIEMNTTADDSKLITKIDLDLNKEEEKSYKNLILDDIFFEKGGKQNASLNCLPPFEEVFDIKKYELIFEEKLPQLDLIKNKSTKSFSSEKFVANDMGTTANIMLIKNGVIYIANVGDSLSVMYKNKKAYNLNREHQLIIPSEKERVLKSGAKINGYRINGMLNLTRAIGDLSFKSNIQLKRHEQSVIALPEILKIQKILILLLWDVMEFGIV